MSRRLLICFLSSAHTPFDKRVFAKEAVTLAAAGFEVVHLAPHPTPLPRTKGVEIVTLAPLGERWWRRIRGLARLYRRARTIQADCYHCNEIDSWLVGLALKLRHGARCVFDVHEHYPGQVGELSRWRPLGRVGEVATRALFAGMAQLSDGIILAKRSVRDDFPARANTILVRNFAQLTALPAAAPRALERDPGPLRLVHLGLISRIRGWPQLLDAMALLPRGHVHLSVVGTFNDGSAPAFAARVRDLGLDAEVEVEDWMPFDEAFALVCRCDVGLILFQPGLKNHVFAMPHKMFDYMLAGAAVILPSFAEEVAPIVREEECGVLVDPADAADIARAVAQLAGDRGLYREMGERGRQAVLRTYNWEAEAEPMIEFYRKMAGSVDSAPAAARV